MTFAEINRAVASHNRNINRKERERASFDYILAELIGRSVARIYNPSNEMPTIAEAYPLLFSNEEIEEKQAEQIDNLSAIRFTQFANSFNKRFKEANKKE